VCNEKFPKIPNKSFQLLRFKKKNPLLFTLRSPSSELVILENANDTK